MGREVSVEQTVTASRKRKRKSSGTLRVKSRKIAKTITIITSFTECIFCGQGANPELGTFFQDESSQLAAHQFCLFFSAGLPQNGEDCEGFDGYLIADIMKEARRVYAINCKICRVAGASSGCAVRSCRATYHYKCGKDAGMQFVFCGAFSSYCKTHRTYQDLKLIKKLKTKCPAKCPVCLEDISVIDHKTIVRTPCCKHVFIHKNCVQDQANASGYFFRCPTCNDKKTFPSEMVRYGIFTPMRDAAWEADNAYADLLEPYGKCDIERCQCKAGRNYKTKSGKWHLLLCYVCGQSGVHVKCLGKRYIPGIGYACVDCNAVVSLTENTVSKKLQAQTLNRLQEHKRRLQELTARDDPVLLASPVFATPIWCRRFNIKPSCVVIEPITIPIEHLLPKPCSKTPRKNALNRRDRLKTI